MRPNPIQRMLEYGGPTIVLVVCAAGLTVAPANVASSQVEGRNATAIDIEVVGQIGHPLAEVSDVLLDLDGFQRWFPALREWRVLSRGRRKALVYGRQELPWPLRDRDYVVEYRWRESSDTQFSLTAVARPGADPPPERDVRRLEEMTTVWRLVARGEETQTSYVYRGPLDLALPDWVVEAAWKAHSAKVTRERFSDRLNA